jgi:acyl carrier protein
MSATHKVIELVAEQMGVDGCHVTEETVVADVDELQRVEILWALEDEFRLKIPDEDFGGLKTVGCLVRYLGERVQVGG